jgi:hypothetical protein
LRASAALNRIHELLNDGHAVGCRITAAAPMCEPLAQFGLNLAGNLAVDLFHDFDALSLKCHKRRSSFDVDRKFNDCHADSISA